MMKKIKNLLHGTLLFGINFVLLSFYANGQSTNSGPYTTYGFAGGNMCETTPWQLVFHDEFNGNSIDANKWSTFYPYSEDISTCYFCRTHDKITTNNESQVFKDENVIVSNGTVKLIIKNDNPIWLGHQKPFSSGMIYSKDYFAFQRGKFEIRCKIPSGQGLWPAFWAYGHTPLDYDREIDVFEFRRGSTNTFEMSLHKWLANEAGTNSYSDIYTGIDYSTAFHTFAIEWDKNVVTWYVDGNPVNRIFRLAYNTLGQRMDNCVFNSGYYKQMDWFPINGKLNVIAGLGTEGGNNAPPTSGTYPKQMEIEYIRVYQREPEPAFSPICTVNGNDVICINQNSVFNVPEDFGTVTWTASPNLDIISSNNTSITIRPKSNVTYGSAWIKVDFNQQSACGSFSSTKNFWIGTPDPISVTEHVYPCDQCFSIDAFCSPSSKATYNWNVGNGQYNNYDCATTTSFFIPYTLTVSNVCGSQNASGTLVSPYCNGDVLRSSQSISFSPNPVSSIAQITLNNIELNDINQILILNKNGSPVKRITSRFESIFNLDVTSYQNGTYGIIVNLKGKNQSISANFTVQH